MKILVYRWDIYPYENIIQTLKRQGHLVDVLAFPVSSHIWDESFVPLLEQKLAENIYDFVFSVNFYAVIAQICFQKNIRYVSWNCDTPLLSMLHPSVTHPTNIIFTFDRAEYKKLKDQGLSHIYYLPLAGMLSPFSEVPADAPRNANSADNDAVHTINMNQHGTNYRYDISFVGSLYEKNRYDEMCFALPDRLRGYMDAIIEAGRQLSGGNFITRMLSDEILSEVSRYISLEGDALSDEALRIHFETAVLSYKIAADTRADSLYLLSQNHKVDLFTSTPGNNSTAIELENEQRISLHPPVDYQQELPDIFLHSKINLNFTIPNITDGIPLRVFDILSCGGFLLTDYRDALCELFEDGKDLIIFHSMEDLMKKADYYLSHPDERESIARSGMEKVRSLHNYDKRLKEIVQNIK